MTTADVEQEPVRATGDEQPAIAALEQLLNDRAGRFPRPARPTGDGASDSSPPLRLTGPRGETVELPGSVVRLLREAVHYLAKGDAVAVVPVHQHLTVQQAADLLAVSQPHLLQMLGHGELPYTGRGVQRRIELADVIEYKRRRAAREEAALDELVQLSQDLGLYR